jgi:hypothetical protein
VRFARWCLLIWLSCLLPTTSATIIGKQQPVSPGARLLHLTECELPCWIGIVPNQTRTSEALKQIERVYGHEPTFRILNWGTPNAQVDVTDEKGDKFLGITLNYFGPDDPNQADPIVSHFALDFQAIAVGELYAALRDPVDVILYQQNTVPELILRFHGGLVHAFVPVLPCNKVGIDSPIRLLLIYGQPPTHIPWLLYNPVPWRGVAACHKFQQ